MIPFSTITADYPWNFKTYSQAGQGRSPEYLRQPVEFAKKMPVKEVSAKDSALIMWTSGPYLQQTFAIAEAWGFQYKTVAFVWAKLTKRQAREQAMLLPIIGDNHNWHFGNGYWTRANTEIALLFTRGNPKRLSASVRQLIIAPLGRHSEKPEEMQDRVEQLVAGPYLELFARRQRPNWTCLGNEVTGNDICDDLVELLRRINETNVPLSATIETA
jgi:N6-adenosine-specific RNA methylase IME4